jgi:hypothetical protein
MDTDKDLALAQLVKVSDYYARNRDSRFDKNSPTGRKERAKVHEEWDQALTAWIIETEKTLSHLDDETAELYAQIYFHAFSLENFVPQFSREQLRKKIIGKVLHDFREARQQRLHDLVKEERKKKKEDEVVA